MKSVNCIKWILNSLIFFIFLYFSCNVNSQINGNPKLPVLRYDDDGNLESSISPRIVGGTEAAAGEFQGKISIQVAASYPFIVYHFCGGTLIHASHVLTAAHCVITANGSVRSPSYFMLVGDDLYINQISPTRQAKTASHVFVHPQYTIDGFLNDVAVIRASSPFIVSPTFSPVARIQNSPIPDISCSVAGWGTTSYQGNISPRLLRINATVIDRGICNARISYNGLIKNGMFCAGSMAGGIDACQGDSGGGIICGTYIAGVVSWGVECALPNLPGVYTDVAVFNNWIDEVLLWDGEHENIPTPTTIIIDSDSTTTTPTTTPTTLITETDPNDSTSTTFIPNDSTATLYSLNLILACASVLIMSL